MTKPPVLRVPERHLVSRLTWGTTPALVREVRRTGAGPWLARQLRPARIPDRPGQRVDGWWPHLWMEPLELWQRHVSGTQQSWRIMLDYAGWVMARRIQSRRQVHEVMAGFWENHFHVPFNSDPFPWRPDYGRTLRRHALGRFDDLLVAAVTHPAMLVWLDGASSTKAAPNENLGRELLELFTLGVGNFTERDVKQAALVLTGWHVDSFRTWAASYRTENHYVGEVRVAGFHHANGDPDGQDVTRAMLRHLARQPATARHLAHKLATKFVRDDPPADLVGRLADVYLGSDTAIAPVVRALVASPEFRRSAGAKLRDPVEDVVATYRALRTRLEPPLPDQSPWSALVWQTGQLGLQIGEWPRPDGAPIDNRPWASTLRALGSLGVHRTVAHGWWPDSETGAHPRPARAWAPRLPVRLDRLVDHASRLLLGRPATTAAVEAVCLRLDLRPGTVIDRDHAVMTWRMGDLLTALLDSPAHYHR